MKFPLLIIAFLLYPLFNYSQSGKLKYLQGNSYLIKVDSINITGIETYLKENYNQLKKNERGLVRAIVLNLKNDTLTVIDYDSKGIEHRIYFNSGKRGMVELRTDLWIE